MQYASLSFLVRDFGKGFRMLLAVTRCGNALEFYDLRIF